MDLQTYVKLQKHLLDKFEQDWEKRSLRQPSAYSSELPSSEWDARFNLYLETRYNEPQKESGK